MLKEIILFPIGNYAVVQEQKDDDITSISH